MLSINCKHRGQITNQECFECFKKKQFRKFTDEIFLSRPECKKHNVTEEMPIQDPDPIIQKKERKMNREAKNKKVSLNKIIPANVETTEMNGFELKRNAIKEKLTNFFLDTENVTDNEIKIKNGDFFVTVKFKIQKERKTQNVCVRTTIFDENGKKVETYGERTGYIPTKAICKKIIKYANCLNPINAKE